jgi:polysaccharide pyruvyl transferase WcaK-like protein
MAEGRDFIAFLRKADAIGKPFVTLEYNLKNQRLQQCYGERDSRPAPEVQAFAEAWAEKVTETLKEEERERKRAEAAAAEEEERQRLIRNRREALA